MQIKEILSKPWVAVLLIVLGPIVTLLWVYSLQIPESEISHTALKKTITYIALISVVVSFVMHLLLSFTKGLIWSSIISEIVCIATFAAFALTAPENAAKNLMWLPIMSASVAALSLPMAFSIAYGSGVIINTIRKGKKDPLKKAQQKNRGDGE
jgi:hypothetical protein